MIALILSPADLALFARILAGEPITEAEYQRSIEIIDDYDRSLRLN